MIPILIGLASIALLVIGVSGLAWILDDLAPHEMRDWSSEPIEEAETTEGERP